jgi:GNAT superfamily N-acetyltransferase
MARGWPEMVGFFFLREVRAEDAPEIARLAEDLGYASSPVVMRDRLNSLTSLPNHHICVAQGTDCLLGWVAVERRSTLELGERVEIVGLVVDVSSRRTGLGRQLVEYAEQWARQLGFDSISVRSNVNRDASHPFYERLGYLRRKTQHCYVKTLTIC